MKYFFVTLLMAFLLSCLDEPTVPSPPAASKATDPSTSSISPVLYFKAWGNEPGWNLQMIATSDGTFPIVLVLDYGADTLSGVIRKMPIMEPTPDGKGRAVVGSNEVKYTGLLEIHGTQAPIEMSIVSGICNDDADIQHGTSVTIALPEQQLKGCGDYFD
jgi:hypothetical protein